MDITSALNEYKPTIAASYKNSIKDMFQAMVNKLGPTLKNVYNDWTYAKVFTQSVRKNLSAEKISVISHDTMYSINEEALDKNAAQYADEAVAEWKLKIERKLVSIENASVQRLTGTSFRINGTIGDKKVMIEQNMIINVSKHGVLFNQFPARIYFDGKATSEAKYKKMMGEV
jgi:hypothetical protein